MTQLQQSSPNSDKENVDGTSITTSVKLEVTPEDNSATLKVKLEVTPEDNSVTLEVTPEVTPEVTTSVKLEVIPEVKTSVTTSVTPENNSEMVPSDFRQVARQLPFVSRNKLASQV